jgi:hypothetical protein
MKRLLLLPLLLLCLCRWAGAQYSVTVPLTLTTVPTLVAGSGFSGATAQPASVGNSGAAGYSENVIGRWDVVPYQAVAGTLQIGIVAFHIEGIKGVSFSLDGGAWVHATQIVGNAASGASEYCAIFDATALSDAQREIRAVVYPINGPPMVFQGTNYSASEPSLYLFSNSGGTYTNSTVYVKPSTGSDSNPGTSGSPFQTIDKALDALVGGPKDIELMEAGTYSITPADVVPSLRYSNGPINNTRWSKIYPSSGLTRSSVIIGGTGGRTYVNKIQFSGVTIDRAPLGNNLVIEDAYLIWLDTVQFIDSSSTIAGTWNGAFSATETITQGTTGATAKVCDGTFQGDGTTITGTGTGTMSVYNVTGSPDASHVWTGGSSGKSLTPTGLPIANGNQHVTDTGPVKNAGSGGAAGAAFCTNCFSNGCQKGFTGIFFSRGCDVQGNAGDSYQNSTIVINCTEEGGVGGARGDHADFFQYFPNPQNVVIYGFTGTNTIGMQPFFLGGDAGNTMRDMAFVHVRISQTQADDNLTQISCPSRNLYFENVTTNKAIIFRDDNPPALSWSGTNVVFESCSFSGGIPATTQSGATLTGVTVR